MVTTKETEYEILVCLHDLNYSELVNAIFTVMYVVYEHVREHDNVHILHSIDLKFCMYIIGYRHTTSIDFAGCRTYRFFHSIIKKLLYITAYGLKLLEVHISIVKLFKTKTNNDVI